MRRVSSSVLVGRDRELARLGEAFEDGDRGRATFLLVAGEAGVGKTRFAAAAGEMGRLRGSHVLVGSCLDMGGDAQAFAPLRESLRRLRSEIGPEAFEHVGGTRRDGLGMLLSGTETAGPRLETVGVGADTGQARLFDAWLGLLRQLGKTGPPLFIVEDLHWADRSTFDLLRYLAHNDLEVPFVVLATYRSDEVHRTHPLVPVLVELQRKPSVVRLELRGFERTETAELIHAIRGPGADARVIDLIHDRSDGNAFYVEQLLIAEAAGGVIPDSLREILLATVGTLQPETQELLRCASVGGLRLSTRVLASVMDHDPADLEASLAEAVERHLLVSIEDAAEERFMFRHALVQEAVQGEVLPGRRARLHGLFATAIAESGMDLDASAAAELAHHWYAAHDLPRALEASLVAGELAEAMHADGDAYAQYERALELWDQVPEAERRGGIDRIVLLEDAARAAGIVAPTRAFGLIREALQLGTGRIEDTRLASLKQQLSRYAWISGDGVTALEAAREALALLPAEPPSLSRARALASLGQILMVTLVTLESAEAKRISEEAVATARALHSTQIEAHALNTLGCMNVYLGDLETGVSQLQQSLDMSLSIGSVDDVARAHINIADALGNSGQFEEAARAGLEWFEYAKDQGLARLYGVLELSDVALAFHRAGSWAAAWAAIEQARRYAVAGVAEIMIEERAALLEVGQGRFDDAAARLDRVGQLLGRVVEAQLIAPRSEAAAELALWQGRPADARAELQAAFGRLPKAPGYISRIGPLLALAVRAEADLSTVARAHRDSAALSEARAEAEWSLGHLRSLDDAARAGFPNFATQAAAWYAAGVAEMSRVEGHADPSAWAAAVDAFAAAAMPYPKAYGLFRLAEATLARRGSRSEAAQALRAASTIGVKLGSGPLLADIEALAARARIDLAQPAEGARPSGVVPREAGLLTSREREIIELVAAGRTNRQIAETLFITEKTAGHHVSNILGKLGVQGRTEAAAVAQRLGLLEH